MPYIIETRRGCGYCTHCGYGNEPSAECLHKQTARTAVATLDEVNSYAESIGADWRDLIPLDEDGGTIGPLPDGTVIEVRQIGLGTLASQAGFAQYSEERSAAAILAAFNAA